MKFFSKIFINFFLIVELCCSYTFAMPDKADVVNLSAPESCEDHLKILKTSAPSKSETYLQALAAAISATSGNNFYYSVEPLLEAIEQAFALGPSERDSPRFFHSFHFPRKAISETFSRRGSAHFPIVDTWDYYEPGAYSAHLYWQSVRSVAGEVDRSSLRSVYTNFMSWMSDPTAREFSMQNDVIFIDGAHIESEHMTQKEQRAGALTAKRGMEIALVYEVQVGPEVRAHFSNGSSSEFVFRPLREYLTSEDDDSLEPRKQIKAVRYTYAAARLNEAMGLYTTPRARLAVVNGMPGVLQERLRRAKSFEQADPNAVSNVAAFECLVGNIDLHTGNLMPDEHEIVKVFDHGSAFFYGIAGYKISNKGTGLGAVLPNHYTPEFIRGINAMSDEHRIRQAVGESLSEGEIQGVLLRRDIILADLKNRESL